MIEGTANRGEEVAVVFKAYEEFKQVVDDYVASMVKVETASSATSAKVGDSWMSMDKTIASLGSNEVLSGKVMEHFRGSTEKASTDVVASSTKIASGYKGVSDSAGGAEKSSNKVNRELSKLGDITEYAGAGLKRIRNIIEGMAFGVVIGAVSALTEELIALAKEHVVTEEVVSKLDTSVTNQAEAWKLLPNPINSVTSETVNLYNAQLKYLQLLERDKGSAIQQQIDDFETMRRSAEITAKALPGRAEDMAKSIARLDVKISESKVELERWKELMELTPTSVGKVAASIDESISVLKIPDFSEGMLQGLVNTATLEIPDDVKASFELKGGMFGEYLATGARDSFETTLASAIGDAKFDVFGPEQQTAMDDEYAAWQAHEDRLLDLRLSQWEQEKQLNALRLENTQQLAGNMSNAMQSLFVATGSQNKAMFNAYKVFAVSEALISTYLAINKTIAQGGWWAIPLAVSVGAMGFANAAAIASQEMTGAVSDSSTTSTGATITTGDTSTSDLAAASTSDSSAATQNITVNIQNGSGSAEYWQDVFENNIIPAMNDAADRNIEITINRA